MKTSKFSRPHLEVKIYLPYEDEAELMGSKAYQLLLREFLQNKKAKVQDEK